MRNAYRTNQVRAEIAEIEADIARNEAKKKFEADRPAREAATQQAEHERRELKRRLLLDANESQDFQPKKYDGRFPDALSVEKAIRESWAAFLENHDLDKTAQNTVTLFLQLHPDADVTLPSTFEAALAYLESKLCPAEAPATVSVQTTPVASTSKFPQQETLIAGLQKELDALPVGNSRARESLSRRIYQEELRLEVLAGDEYQEILSSIQNDSGKVLSGENSMKFLSWLSMPAQKRRFKSKLDVKFAFVEFFNAPEILTDSEREELQYRATVNGMSSDDVKRAVGFRNDYGSRTVPGIRQ
jgi:hypothetical protein